MVFDTRARSAYKSKEPRTAQEAENEYRLSGSGKACTRGRPGAHRKVGAGLSEVAIASTRPLLNSRVSVRQGVDKRVPTNRDEGAFLPGPRTQPANQL